MIWVIIDAHHPACHSRKGQKNSLLLDGGLVKGYPLRIWVIIRTPHHTCRKSNLGSGGWSIINDLQTKRESLDWGLSTTNSPVVGGASGYEFHPLQGVMTLHVSESAVPNNGKVGNQELCPHSRCFESYFDVIFLMYMYIYW